MMGLREEIDVCSPIPSIKRGEVGRRATADCEEIKRTIDNICHGKAGEARQQEEEEDGY